MVASKVNPAEGHDEILLVLGEIRGNVCALATDVTWIKDQHKKVCDDIEDLRKFQWTIYGISVILSLGSSILAIYFWH